MVFKIRFLVLPLLLLAYLVTMSLAQEEESAFSAEEPVLITSAGQSADVLMIKILSDKAGISYKFEKTASTEVLDSVKSVIIVTGGSSKGLGAAAIDKAEELKRVAS